MSRDTIYKYHRNNVNLHKLLKGNYLWLSKPEVFNDPFDFKYRNEMEISDETINRNIERVYAELMSKYPVTQNHKSNSYNLIHQNKAQFIKEAKRSLSQTFQKYGVCCFSKEQQNTLMWSHYTAGHSGVCLHFKRFPKNGIEVKVLDVKYSRSYPVLKRTEDGIQVLATKSDDWDYEDEVRLIRRSGPGPFHFDKSDLIGITFGCKMPNNEIGTIMELVRSLDYPEVRFYQAKQNPKKYQLDIEEIKEFS